MQLTHLMSVDNIDIGGSAAFGSSGTIAASVGVQLLAGRKRDTYKNTTTSPMTRRHIRVYTSGANSHIEGIRVNYHGIGSNRRVVCVKNTDIGLFWTGPSADDSGETYIETIWDQGSAMLTIRAGGVDIFTRSDLTGRTVVQVGGFNDSSLTAATNTYNLLAQQNAQLGFSDYYRLEATPETTDVISHALGPIIVRNRTVNVAVNPTGMDTTALTTLANATRPIGGSSHPTYSAELYPNDGNIGMSVTDTTIGAPTLVAVSARLMFKRGTGGGVVRLNSELSVSGTPVASQSANAIDDRETLTVIGHFASNGFSVNDLSLNIQAE